MLLVPNPIPMLLFCPQCDVQHIDAPFGEWHNPPHKSHLCAACGHVWRVCDYATTGVAVIESKGQLDGDARPIVKVNPV